MSREPRRLTRRSAVTAVLTGAVSAAVATYTKSQAEAVLQPQAEKLLPPRPGQKTAIGADPAGHPENMPPAELADRTLHAVADGQLTDGQREKASDYLHWVMGVGFGVAYAVTAVRFPAVRAGRGLAAGAALFGGTHASLLPALGVQHSPATLPTAWWVWEGGSHLIYGAVLDAGLTVADRFG